MPDLTTSDPVGLNFHAPIVLLVEHFLRIALLLSKGTLVPGQKALARDTCVNAALYWQRAAQVGVYGAIVG
ncbi:MAG: hypothetical protein M3248_02475 [Actinomycetota bacterium]|nr:hypothetical protein [Actinomycetota bacterium]